MISRMISAYKKRALRKKMVAELESLTDRDLADIGIKRWDIEQIVREEIRRRDH